MSSDSIIHFNKFEFGLIDYALFSVGLCIALAIGIYFGYFVKSANTTDEYLLGQRQMKVLPIAMSLIASQVSPLSVVMMPVEFYFYGLHYLYVVLAFVFLILIMAFLLIPIFYSNNISNCYEYLEKRFDKKTRQAITVSFLLTVYLVLPVFIFIPSLAFSQVTGLDIHLINTVVCSICIFYTMLGGIKAVVWTDVVQGTIMFGSALFVGIMGIIKVGGLGEVLDRSIKGGRLHTDFSFDLTTRATFWNCFVGGIVMWTGYVGLNQSCVQRIVALPTLKKARWSLLYFTVGFFIIMSFNCFAGFIMYAKYYDCDPVKAGIVQKPDKLMPFFVQDILGHLKGMPGVFISCVFSAALSTMSAYLNSLSGIVYFDYIRPFVRHTERKANIIMKVLVAVTGLYCILGGIVVEKFTSILQMVITIGGVTHGAIFGTFTLGMLVPRAHANAAFWSTILSLSAMVYLMIAAQVKIKAGDIKYVPLPTSIDGCENYNITVPEHILYANLTSPANITFYQSTIIKNPDEFSITNTTFNWYCLAGALLVWVFGIPMSYLLPDGQDKKLDPKLVSPIVRSFIPKRLRLLEEIPLKERNGDVNTIS